MHSIQEHQSTSVKISQTLVITDLLDLLHVKLLVLRIQGCYPRKGALTISEKLIEQDTLEKYYRACFTKPLWETWIFYFSNLL